MHLSRFGVTRQFNMGDYQALEGDYAPHAADVQRVAHQSASERRRPRALRRTGQIARDRDPVDSTLASPYNLRPLEFGVDFVVHSCTNI